MAKSFPGMEAFVVYIISFQKRAHMLKIIEGDSSLTTHLNYDEF
jgi:hypothetical protein